MKAKVLSTIQQHQMFTQGAVLLVAVSGGADSVALLHFLRELREEWNLTLRALHLNHNLREPKAAPTKPLSASSAPIGIFP